jgi:arylsulfatase
MRTALLVFGALLVAAIVIVTSNHQVSATPIDRTRLPIAQPITATVTQPLPANAVMPEPWEVRAPEGAPNVVIILLDDIGFGAPSPFGGPGQHAYAAAPCRQRTEL